MAIERRVAQPGLTRFARPQGGDTHPPEPERQWHLDPPFSLFSPRRRSLKLLPSYSNLSMARFSWTQRNSTSLLDLPAEIHEIIHKALFAGFKFEVCIDLPHGVVLRASRFFQHAASSTMKPCRTSWPSQQSGMSSGASTHSPLTASCLPNTCIISN